MLNEVKHLAIAWEILPLRLRSGLKAFCAQNDTVHYLTCDKALRKQEATAIFTKTGCPHLFLIPLQILMLAN
jgi:hypothetical protein